MQVRRKVPYIPILTGVTLAFVMAALAFIGLMLYYNNPFVQVGVKDLPNLVGIKYETAVAQNEEFEIVAEETIYSDEWGKGVIIDQKPKAGIEIKHGSQVRVTVSLGQLIVQMPNFTGKDARQTISWLNDNGLAYKEEKVYNSEIAAGCVIYTDPSKDSSVNSGTLVTVYVSMGPERLPVALIDVTGLKSDVASNQLQAQGLLASINQRYSSAEAGTVISQDPPAGAFVDQGTPVTLIVSMGPDPAIATQSTARLRVALPDVDREILIRAWVNDKPVAQATLNPAERESPTWSVTLRSDQVGETLVKIYVDGKLYDTATVYFEPPAPAVEEEETSAVD